MSATLFGRGVMAQVGGRQRAEATDKAISSLRTEIASLQYLQMLPTQVRALEARLQATEQKVTSLEAELASVKAAAVTPAPTA